ncbi:hypothetical protein JHK82_032151 [Glycine max]|nr:hypothetical protein JHK85_032824 [Glycine max]KAG4995427.1 hypothetical protein JHK86_032254 [Glycine max]KAG5125414.1 hypothetical protein JHK82_032151 [Glycine max]KAG5146848.1 hypothetical protein JHK84_032391 [Glycine max]
MVAQRIIIVIVTLFTLFHLTSVTATAPCQFSFLDGKKLYNYTLSSPIRNFPHGILSEDGFYKVAVNDTTLWFQLCDGMIFNHDPPICADCWDCGGPKRCGMECNALVANNVGGRIPDISIFSNLLSTALCLWWDGGAGEGDVGGGEAGGGKLTGGDVTSEILSRMESSSSNKVINAGYHVCTAIGRGQKIDVDIIDKKNPHTGVIVKMSNSGPKYNCSLAVSVLCNLNGVQGPRTLERLGACDYVTELKHPSGCAIIVNVHGGGLGWFGTLLIIVLCLFAAYLLAGIVYRFFFLGIRGIDIIPNLDFWVSLPRRTQSLCASLARKFKGPSEGHRSTYSPVNF